MATNFWELLQQHQGDLTKSGRTVADYLVQHAAEAQYLSISSLAKGHGALSLGNVIGANVFNLVLVSGVSAAVAPFTIPQNSMLFGHNASLVLEFPVMFAVMLLLTLPALIKGKLSRPQGIALLCIYAAFCVVQFTI